MLKTEKSIIVSLLNELKKFFSIFCTLNVWAVLLVFIPLKNENNSEKNILRKSWIITMICTSSNNPLPPLLHISSKNYWAVSSLPSLEKCRRQKSSLIKKQTSNKLTKRIFLPKFSKLLILKTWAAIFTTILKLGVRWICSSFNLCNFLKSNPYWFTFKSHSYSSIKCFQLMSWWSKYSVN